MPETFVFVSSPQRYTHNIAISEHMREPHTLPRILNRAPPDLSIAEFSDESRHRHPQQWGIASRPVDCSYRAERPGASYISG